MTNPFKNPYGSSTPTQQQPAPVGQPNGQAQQSSPFTNPFDASAPQVQPIGPDQNILDANPYKPMSNRKAFAVGVATTIGKALQPLMAPQQIIFGGIGAIEDLATGQGATAAAATFARGLGAAGDYATYGLTARPGVGNGADDRQAKISGFQLAKKANLPDIIAKPVGIAADFLIDVPLIGKIGQVTKLGRLAGVTTDINHLAAENMAVNFLKPGGVATNPADWDIQGLTKFALRVAASPVSTAPVRDVVNAVPRGIRDQVAGKIAGAIENARTAPVQGGRILGQNAESGKTLAQLFISRFGNVEGLPTMGGQQIRTLKQTGNLTGTGVAREVQGDIYRAQIEATNLTIKAADAQSAYKKLTDGFSQATKDSFDDIAHRLLDWRDVTQYAQANLDLQQFATSIGNPAFAQTAREALYKTAHLETYGGLLRYRNGTMGLDEAAGYQAGLARYERDTFGQPKPVTQEVADLQTRMAQRVAGFQQAGVPFVPPEGMHLRRSFQLQYNPNRQIQKVLDAKLPPQIMNVDDTKLGDAFHTWALKTNAPSPMLAQASQQLARDFKAFYTNPGQNEPQALMTFLTGKGFTPQESVDFINHTGRQFHQNGITYRPNYTSRAPGEDGVAEILRKMADNPSNAPVTLGSSSPAMGLSNKPLQSRADLPEWMTEAMGQITDIGKLLDENVRIGGKQYMNRSIVQDVHDFLQREGGILTTSELHALPGNAGGVHSNWRAVDDTLAQRLKGGDDRFSPVSKDTPFNGDTYIPAAYHDLLTTFSQVDDPGVRFAALQLLNTSFKAHKVANPAAIARDIASNFRFADDLGINPLQMNKAIGQALALRARAVKGDGIFDMNAKVTVGGQDIYWKDIVDHGGFVHGNFVVNEIQDSYAALRNSFANDTGSPLQRATAAFIDHADRVARARGASAANGNFGAQVSGMAQTSGAVATDLALGLGGPVTKKLTDIKGDIDTVFKMATYIHKRGQGMDSEKAAQYADELFFNYANQPIVVDFLRKNGISPFAAFQFMASGRFIKTLYQNPYAVARYYRLPDSLSQGDNQARGEMKYTTPSYMQRDLWVPLPTAKGSVRDSQNRLMMFNLATVMPESALFDFFSGDAISNWVPPYVGLMQQVVTGQGYGGIPLYAGGKNAGDTFHQDPTEWARGVVKALHMYGATPYAPGTPTAERLAKAIVASAVPADQIAGNKLVQGYLKYMGNGALAAPFDTRFATTPQGLRQQAPLDVPYAAARLIGSTSMPVTGTFDQPGTALSNMTGLSADKNDIQNLMRQRIRAAGGDAATIKAVVDEYMPQLMQIANQAKERVDFQQKFARPFYRNQGTQQTPNPTPTTDPFR